MASDPGQISFFLLIATLTGFLPTIFWLWFWLQEDRQKPEPLRLIIKTFLIGAFFVFLVFLLELFFAPPKNIIEQISNAYQENFHLWSLIIISGPLIIFAFIEELAKYIAARFGALRNMNCDEPIDIMIYMITAALGFSAIENFIFLFNILTVSGTGSNNFIFTGNLRFLGATLLHTVSSAVLGAFLGFAFYRNKIIKKIAWILGLIVATSLHVIFNFFIIVNGEKDILGILIYLWLATIIIIFIFEIIRRLQQKRTITCQINKLESWQRW